ncbi:aminotransferase class V-fold PLP-dependent enzyme [Pelotomaculum terephthalicicum JT]|uniref:aminotransferase class V-fold PLP-dependent enzyme n=1 Tax=Pelotomaculum TaxID=191373 RepID=UPI0009D4EB97|nr:MULTISPECIES: aminotransferase class V-fold PLP-dependent enzyme [Pelotomaculum]MCG9969323.1 aminotransferase class V-fold PLP-dependent enzyme [Pelotomaculum terephthalicicum JT]OPX89162.1 MAG: putative cysteine desulfurase [Pelotomaculum sp. PtaB.Bin117]
MVYLDNAATSWPKPETVHLEMIKCVKEYGANPGRSGHRMAMKASEKIFECRENLARLFGITDPLRIVFASNATEAINLAVKGLLASGDHAIISSMEHNAVVRPLKKLETAGVELSIVKADLQGKIDPTDIAKRIKPNTTLLVVTHASNVTGTVNDLACLGRLAKKHNIFFMVDAAQTAGSYPVHAGLMNIDLLAFAGHKGLFGPQGTGGLYVRAGLRLDTLKEGGTGSISESPWQPDFLPDRFESGTLNTPGIAGLSEGVKYVLETGIENIRNHENRLTGYMLDGLSEMKKVRVHGCGNGEQRIGVVSITIDGKDCHEVCRELDERYDIAARGGLHCAYLAHETIGTQKTGTIRFSIGFFNTIKDIDKALTAVQAIAGT